MEAKTLYTIMDQRYFIGIDVSKSKLDIAVITEKKELVLEKIIVNSQSAITKFLKSTLKREKMDNTEVLVCCEATGIYSSPLKRACLELGIDLWIEHPVKIKRASTDMRGKNDRQDALRIAEYAYRYKDKQLAYRERSETVTLMEQLIKVRDTLIDKRVALENQLREAKTHDRKLYKVLKDSYDPVLKSLNKQILKAENKIENVAKEEESIRINMALLMSIKGIGTQSAIHFIIRTDNFRLFTNAKHLACYAGVVPFTNESGTIIKKSRVSHYANLNLKKLLHMAAMAAVRAKGELRDYYLRKVAEGKNKMSVLNAIRNKLVHRMFAVIKRQTPYIPT